MTPARELRAAVLLCLLGAGLVLGGASAVWARLAVAAVPVSPPRTVEVAGGTVLAGVPALGLVGLAGVVALAATRRTGRRLVGLLVLLAGAGVVAVVLGTDLAAASLRVTDLTRADLAAPVERTLWPAVTVTGGVLLALAGLATAVRGSGWPALGRRYDAPAPRAAGEAGVWAALDRGEDPTRVPDDDARPDRSPPGPV